MGRRTRGGRGCAAPPRAGPTAGVRYFGPADFQQLSVGAGAPGRRTVQPALPPVWPRTATWRTASLSFGPAGGLPAADLAAAVSCVVHRKVLTDFPALRRELERPEFRYVVPDFRLNKAFAQLAVLPAPLRDKVEFLLQRVLPPRLPRPQSLVTRPSLQNRPARPRTPLHRARRERGIPLLPRDGKPRVYRRG